MLIENSFISISRILTKTTKNQTQTLMEINTSSLSLALKYVKYYYLGLNPKNTFRLDLRLLICHGNLEVKQQYQ